MDPIDLPPTRRCTGLTSRTTTQRERDGHPPDRAGEARIIRHWIPICAQWKIELMSDQGVPVTGTLLDEHPLLIVENDVVRRGYVLSHVARDILFGKSHAEN